MKILILFCLLSANAFAEISSANIMASYNKATPAQGGSSTANCPDCADLPKIKLGCKNPGAVHNQMPPSDIKVFCTEKACKWDLGTPTTVYKENTGVACGRIATSKSNLCTKLECSLPNTTQIAFPMPTLEEKCGVYNTVYSVTCDQIEKMTTIIEFCQSQMVNSSELMEWKPTGKIQKAILGPEINK